MSPDVVELLSSPGRCALLLPACVVFSFLGSTLAVVISELSAASHQLSRNTIREWGLQGGGSGVHPVQSSVQ
jgi:hypothetical protein